MTASRDAYETQYANYFQAFPSDVLVIGSTYFVLVVERNDPFHVGGANCFNRADIWNGWVLSLGGFKATLIHRYKNVYGIRVYFIFVTFYTCSLGSLSAVRRIAENSSNLVPLKIPFLKLYQQ